MKQIFHQARTETSKVREKTVDLATSHCVYTKLTYVLVSYTLQSNGSMAKRTKEPFMRWKRNYTYVNNEYNAGHCLVKQMLRFELWRRRFYFWNRECLVTLRMSGDNIWHIYNTQLMTIVLPQQYGSISK